MLTKKYYEMIAEAVCCAPWTEDELTTHKALVFHLAAKFAADNPKFDRARFLQACGVAQS